MLFEEILADIQSSDKWLLEISSLKKLYIVYKEETSAYILNSNKGTISR